MRRLDIDTQDLSHLLPEQRKVLQFIVEAMGRANIPVYFCEDKDVPEDLAELGRAELLRFSDNLDEYLETLGQAVNEKGIVAAGLERRSVKVVSVGDHGFTGSLQDAIKQAMSWAKENLVGAHTAKAGTVGQFTYVISSNLSVDKMLSKAAFDTSDRKGSHLAILKQIPEIIDNSLDVEIHPNYEKVNGKRSSDKIESMDMIVHRLYGAVNIRDEIFRVKTTLFEYRDLKRRLYTYEVKDIELSSRPLAVKAALAKEGVHDNRGVSANRQASGKTDALTSSAGGRADAESRMSMEKVIKDSEDKASNERISCEGIIKLSPATLLVETKLAKGLPGIEKGKLASGQTSGKTDVLTTSASGSANATCFISAAKLLNNIEKSYDPGKKVLEESRKLDRSISNLFLNEPRVNRVLHKAKVYGWAKDGAVHLTQEGVNPYVAIHEYTHLWCYAMQRVNAEGWDAVKNILKDHPMLCEVRCDSIYRRVSDENRQYAEALARISGYSGAERLEVLARKYRTRYGQVEFIKKAKEALSRCWDWAAKDLFDIKSFGEISEVCDRVIYDLASGRDFSEVIADSPQEGQLAVVKDFLPEKTKEALRSLGATDAVIRELQEEGFSILKSPYFRPKTSRDDTDIQRVSGGCLELFCNSQGEVFVTAPGGEHLSVREFASRAHADMNYVQRACLAQEIRNNQRDGKSLKERDRHRTGKTEFKQRRI